MHHCFKESGKHTPWVVLIQLKCDDGQMHTYKSVKQLTRQHLPFFRLVSAPISFTSYWQVPCCEWGCIWMLTFTCQLPIKRTQEKDFSEWIQTSKLMFRKGEAWKYCFLQKKITKLMETMAFKSLCTRIPLRCYWDGRTQRSMDGQCVLRWSSLK